MKNQVIHIGFNDTDTNVAFNEFYLESKRTGRHVKYVSIAGTTNFQTAQNNIFKFLIMAITIRRQAQIFHFHIIQFPWLFILVNRIFGSKPNVILTIHTSYENLNTFYRKSLIFLNLIFGATFVFCSEASKASFKKSIFWKHLKHCPVVLNGFKIKMHETYEKKTKSILIVGRFIELKRPMFAASTLSEISGDEPTFCWVGDGKLRNTVKEAVSKDNRFRFLPFQSREDTQRLMAKSSIFISTSAIEGMPISVLEAAGHGCVLILSDINAHREIAQVIPNTILFNTPKEMLDNIQQVFSFCQKTLNRKYRENKLASTQHFDMDRVFHQYDRIYEGL